MTKTASDSSQHNKIEHGWPHFAHSVGSRRLFVMVRWHEMLLMCALQIKTALIKTGAFEDSMPCHLASGLGAGFFAVICGSPVDVVKSRLMGTPCCFSKWSWNLRLSYTRSYWLPEGG